MRLIGLTSEEAIRKLAESGPNELPQGRRRDFARILVETTREPMFLMLLGAALLYLLFGDIGQGIFMLAGAGGAVALVVFQELRSERALAALRELSQPRVRVIRDGKDLQIPARELVPEDLLLAGEGERLPADGVLVAGEVLSVDESALTGESAPVVKVIAAENHVASAGEAPSEEATPHVFAGTLVVRGQGIVAITRTGARSALGRIGSSLADIAHQSTPLQQTAGRLVALLGVLAVGFCLLVAVSYGLIRHDWLGGALSGITIAVALIPEEFPMVLAVFLALGARRLAAHRVLVRRSAVVEALGGATVLCVDKTGTLTENRMRVARLWRGTDPTEFGDGDAAPDGASALLQTAALASAVRPIDPMDRAIRAIAANAVGEETRTDDQLLRTWPLRPEMMAVIQVWRRAGDHFVAAAKGAPEAIFRLCQLPASDVSRVSGVIAVICSERPSRTWRRRATR